MLPAKLSTSLVLIVASLSLSRALGDPDLWWHLTIGIWIIHNRSVPREDLWNAHPSVDSWKAYSWLHEAAYAALYHQLGSTGLLLGQMFLALILGLSFFLCFSRLSKNSGLGMFLALVALGACTQHFDLRPQSFAWALLAWVILSADSISRAGNIGLIRGLSLFLPFALWANTHLSTVIGIGTLGIWLLDFQHIKKSLRLIGKVLFVALLGTLVTPYIGGEWMTFLQKAEHPFSHLYIREFQPATLHHASSNLLILLLAVVLVFYHHSKNGIPIARLCFCLLFFFAALSVQKFVPFAAVVLCATIASAWSYGGELVLSRLGRGLEQLTMLWEKQAWYVSLLLCLLLAPIAYTQISLLLANPIDRRSVPVAALDFIERNSLEIPLLHTFNEGGYVMFRFRNPDGSPGYRVSIDGRTDVNDPEIVKAFLSTLHARVDWQSYFSLVSPKTVIWDNTFPLVSILLEKTEWCHVFPAPEVDLYASRWSIFVRHDQWNREMLPSRNCK